jgi:hypothetical protein
MPPVASTLNHIVAGSRSRFERDSFTASVDRRIVGHGLKGAIEMTRDASVRAGDRTVSLRG